MNRLTLSVAGGRKTQSIVEACVAAPPGRRILVLTYTRTNQQILTHRLASAGPLAARVDVRGWFSFLLGYWVRPYLPDLHPGRRLAGFNYEGEPGRYAKNAARFLDSKSAAYRVHLPQLALNVSEHCGHAPIDRLCRIYDEIAIDEAQDLSGYDLEILDALLDAPIDLRLVGDVRQALLSTNPREKKNSNYKGIEVLRWFEERAAEGRIQIEHRDQTWRCNPQIAYFADTIFDPALAFPATRSHNFETTEHDGVFVVSRDDCLDYFTEYQPLCLRHNAASARDVELPFKNIGTAKGMDAERVLIWATANMETFLAGGARLEGLGACELYVATTRAQASVAFVVQRPARSKLPLWEPA